jgi:nitrile hydratase beta subunit
VDGIHDLGGMQGFGPVEPERDEPVFHHRWERRVFGINAILSGSGQYGTSEFRHAVERMRPAHYLTSSYYEHWATAVASLLVEHGELEPAGLDDAAGGHLPLAGPLASSSDSGSPAPRDGEPRRFEVGERVRVRDVSHPGHTRCPRYARGRRGVVVRQDGTFLLPDLEVAGREHQEPTYSVRFDARELWGQQAEAGASVCIDLWQSYLEVAA